MLRLYSGSAIIKKEKTNFVWVFVRLKISQRSLPRHMLGMGMLQKTWAKTPVAWWEAQKGQAPYTGSGKRSPLGGHLVSETRTP